MGKLKDSVGEEGKSKTSSGQENSIGNEKRLAQIVMQGVVKMPAKGFMKGQPLRNLILTSEPRLYMTTTEAYDQVEGTYKKDILLFIQLQVKQTKRDEF
jgi:hypothetical protein